ncbi:hypothetical protein [Novosphingobium aerophilum]|uniref:Uncharacterized protein n=1 Tax=Novosphingobium aerophilum TaxID=2839843 RepID=A0A7X1KD22_9SPHN|nr:hypothetical protein [Novosphingobium aerophilum]MBC2652895.1 hypothetical protein [Novosphingobium aerophilum]
MRRTSWLTLAALIAACGPLHATPPALRFWVDEGEDYDIVTVVGSRGEYIAILWEINFKNPVIYPTPENDEAIVIAELDQSTPDIYDTIRYVRVRKITDNTWNVSNCESKEIYTSEANKLTSIAKLEKLARVALARAVKLGKPVPGETCQPAKEVKKGSRIYD